MMDWPRLGPVKAIGDLSMRLDASVHGRCELICDPLVKSLSHLRSLRQCLDEDFATQTEYFLVRRLFYRFVLNDMQVSSGSHALAGIVLLTLSFPS